MRLIDADAIAPKLEGKFNQDMVRYAPTIDAVPVVRCKDCKHSMLWRKPTDKAVGDCIIRKMHSEDDWFYAVAADDFCSYGERRSE